MPISIRSLISAIRRIGREPSLAAAKYILRCRWTEAKFGGSTRPTNWFTTLRLFLRGLTANPHLPPAPGPFAGALGSLRSCARQGQDVNLTFEGGVLLVSIVAADLFRVRAFRLGEDSPAVDGPQSYLYARPDHDWLPAPYEVNEEEGGVTIRTGRVAFCVSRTDGRVTFRDAEGNVIAEEVAPIGWTSNGWTVCRWEIPSDAHYYGLGQRAHGLDLRGNVCVNWNTDPRTFGTGDDPLDLCIPFWTSLHSEGEQGYGVLLTNTAYSRVDLGRDDAKELSVEVADGSLGYEFFYGPKLETVLERYTERTGRSPLWPAWTLGYHQSRWSYYPDERVRRLAQDLDRHDVLCDAVHLDIHYMDGYRCFTWDSLRFPDPAGLVGELGDQGLKVVTIIDPGIKVDKDYSVFQDGVDQNAFCRYPDGELFVGPVWPGDCAFPDFTAPDVRRWWGEQYRSLLEAGVAGIWNDMNEPALFGEGGATIPGPVLHEAEGQGSDHRHVHNVYGMQMARATAEGLARLQNDRRNFVFTRSGWAGVQRYAANWTGDNRSTWDSLRLTLPMVLGLGLSGVGFTGADVGGFAGQPSAELYTRWLQLGAFHPFFRAHTEWASPDQEPWSWGEEMLAINREVIRLRYRLLPYLYTTLWQCSQTGMPMARPLLLTFQDDPVAHVIDDEFLCGDALLVAPILEEGAVSRKVYLPRGGWYDFWTGSLYQGPLELEVKAPLERIPLFVRAGTVLPMASWMGRQKDRHLILHVYPGDGVSWLYEDDGESNAYQNGEYRLTKFSLSALDNRLDLGREVEDSCHLGYDGLQVLVHGVGGLPAHIEGEAVGFVAFRPESRILEVEMGDWERLVLRW